MKKLFMVIIVLPLLTSLALAGSSLNEAANDVCECLEAPYDQARKALDLVSKAQASGDMSQLMAAQSDMMAVINASTQCFDALPEKYPDIDKSDELRDKVMDMADEQCPNPMSEMAMGQ